MLISRFIYAIYIYLLKHFKIQHYEIIKHL
jgi:hypothetical protein